MKKKALIALSISTMFGCFTLGAALPKGALRMSAPTEQEASDEADACLVDAHALQTRVDNLLSFWAPEADPMAFALPHLNGLTAISGHLATDLDIRD